VQPLDDLRRLLELYDDVACRHTLLEPGQLGHLEHALLEHRAHDVREPFVEGGAPAGVRNQLDAEANLRKADVTVHGGC
jgi:hypothetical protein